MTKNDLKKLRDEMYKDLKENGEEMYTNADHIKYVPLIEEAMRELQQLREERILYQQRMLAHQQRMRERWKVLANELTE